ncbi:MAG: hypothetical protein CSA50_02285 [Gammaproteobacteria bacterium]|nr:MAG: hypothetical protein CSA50_02285 [Gammaproteobacteria bacterium]
MTQPAERLAQVEALRGIAALLVVWLHVTELFVQQPKMAGPGFWLFEVARLFDFGRIGVALFFAISGFVICSSIKGSAWHFVLRRLFRLYPAFWLSVAAGLYFVWGGWQPPVTDPMVLANITMLPAALGQPAVLGLYWTLETELVFYSLCLLLFLTGRVRNPLVYLVISVLLVALAAFFQMSDSWRPALSQWRSMPYHLSIMFWGASFRVFFDNKNSGLSFKRYFLSMQSLLLAHTLVVVLPAVWLYLSDLLTNAETAFRAGIPYLVALAVFYFGCRAELLRNRVLVWFGTISYSLYLFHPVVLHGVNSWLMASGPPVLLSNLFLYLIVILLASTIVAAVSYYLVESPIISLSKRLSSSLRDSR